MAFRRTAHVRSHGRLGLALAVFAATTVAACGADWDLLDPSLGAPDQASAAASSGAGGAASGAGGAASGASGASSAASTSASSSGNGGGSSVSSSSGAGGGSSASSVTYGANVAECVYSFFPDPDDCENDAGNGFMSVDSEFEMSSDGDQAYLRFDLDGVLAGKNVVTVTLRLVVADDLSSDSEQSGEVWEVAPFTKADLYQTVPAKVGMSPLAGDMGPVSQGEKVDWDLPTSLVAPNGSVFLGVFPVSEDGVEYWNAAGDDPPELIIEYL